MKDIHSPVPLSEFFAAVERRLARLTEPGNTSFQVMVCGQIIELRFLTEKYATAAKASLLGRICDKVYKPDAVFYYWSDDCIEYVGVENHSKMLRSKEGNSHIFYDSYQGLTGVNYTSMSFYRCLPTQHAQTNFSFAHVVYDLFYLWARTTNLFLIHAAAIGENGKGILIAGRGGSGKSTLSIGCMLAGMDFVADDYTLISEFGSVTAFPLYTSVMLNPDMAEAYQLRLPINYINDRRGGRLGFDASSQSFCPQLPICAIMSTTFDASHKPSISESLPGKAITRIVHSTIMQVGAVRDPEPVRAMSQRLMGIPSYEMHLSTDLQENVRTLREFIKEDLQHAQAKR